MSRRWAFIGFVGFSLVLGSFGYTVWVSWDALTSGRTIYNLVSTLGEMFPPDFRIVSSLGKAVVETLVMSVMATLLAVCIAFPVSFLAADNTAGNPAVKHAAKAIFNVLRTIPELVMAIIFVASVGFGILPGILALGIHSAGMLGKFYAEAIDKVDTGLIEAVEASGGSRFHVIVFSVIPQILSHSIDFTLYRWEYNFRASTVVGMIGAGGIGFQLIASLRIMEYREVFAILAVVFLMVQLVDAFGNIIRNQLVRGDTVK
ncbi:phosphonate ABC transporter, permease protein PhnE [Paenibacillus alkalitolerans]|uniref:phosphonate ABC transporter, permease protein PhnE n=1 Tax=Paenibacillus alkalitolerans TaxID=2799335 RepID=UPI0018F5E26C|nr:phosphonate ABC transporter, permease protein PhnE [Paenibacillus alkalitolerans]